MSAASAVSLARQSRALTPPPDLTQKASQPTSNYTAVENDYFEVLPCRCRGLVDYAAIGLIMRRTVGGPGRPLWVHISQDKFAEILHVTAEAVGKALDSAESAGLIESRWGPQPGGKKKFYRLCPENWGSAAVIERALERKPAASDNELHTTEEDEAFEKREHCRGEFIVPAGKKIKPFHVTPAVKIRPSNTGAIPVKVAFQEVENGLVDLQVEGEYQEKVTRTGVDLPKNGHTENKAVSPAPTHQEFLQMKDLLTRWFSNRVHEELTDQVVWLATCAKGTADVSELVRRWDARLKSKREISWALVIMTISDVGWKHVKGLASSSPGIDPETAAWEERQRQKHGWKNGAPV